MKKRLLLIAVAGAIVVGCADEMLDTSYESVLKEAQLKGDHPLVFNAYVGNGMANTRASQLFDYEVLTKASDMDETSLGAGITKAAGVFGYYTGTNQPSISSGGIYSGSTNYSASDMSRLNDGNNARIGQANFLYNTKLYRDTGDNNWKTKVYELNRWEPRTLYWPTKRHDQNTTEYVTFFAYYPHVDTYSSSYNDPEKVNLHITAEGQTNIPMLDYQVACGPNTDNYFRNLDLMAAVPVINQNLESSPTSQVDLNFKHLLAAVSIKINYEDNVSASGSSEPQIIFHKAEMQGAHEDGSISELSKFTKRGLFNLATGKWYTRGFEPLNLLGDTWLTENGGGPHTFNRGKYYTLLYDNKLESSTPFITLDSNSLSSINNDHYMLIIPNSDQKKLKVNLTYSIRNGSYFENVDVSKVIDQQIKPGYMYQILLTIKKNQLVFNVNVEDWSYNTSITENI